MLKRDGVDLDAHPNIIHNFYTDKVVFLYPARYENLVVVIPNIWNTRETLVKLAYKQKLYLIYIFFFGVTFACFRLVHKLNGLRKLSTEPFEHETSLLMLTAIGMITNVAVLSFTDPKLRIVTVIVGLMLIVVYNLSQADLIEFLTVSPRSPVDSIEELVRRDYKMYTLPKFQQTLATIVNDSLVQKITSRMQKYPLTQVSAAKLLQTRSMVAVILPENHAHVLAMKLQDRVFIIPQKLYGYYFSLLVRKRLPIVNLINDYVAQIVESGIFKYEWIRSKGQPCKRFVISYQFQKLNYHVIFLNHCWNFFSLLIVLLSVCFMVFVLEISLFRKNLRELLTECKQRVIDSCTFLCLKLYETMWSVIIQFKIKS